MTTTESGAASAVAPDPVWASAPRFLIELIAWVAAPIALWPHSKILAILAPLLLIAIPTAFGMTGAKSHNPTVAVGAVPAIAIELIQPVAAALSARYAWPREIAIGVLVLAVLAVVLQVPRWRWMLAH